MKGKGAGKDEGSVPFHLVAFLFVALTITPVLAAETAKATRQGPTLTVDALAQRRAISPEIYGMNFAPETLAAELKLPVRRWGGNHTSRYNWQNDTWNAAADWYFENVAEVNGNPSALPDGSAVDRFVEQDRRTGTRSLVSLPMIGWVAKRRLEDHPLDCSFKVSKYGAQQDTDVWDRDCGNGVRPDGSFVTGNDPTDASVAVGPDFIGAWIRHLTGKYGTAASGGVAYYALDNEPMLWHETHRDVHPQKVTYDEIRDRSFLYGAAIKAADPSAKTFGPLEWGWCGYMFSAADGCAAGADYRAHGSTNFAPWYLQQMRAYEQQKGLRLLDFFDLHYYPEQAGVALGTAGNATTKALRLRSTRALWDPTYIDESWISDLQPGGIAIRLIPRMRDWIASSYPGTKLSITEYNFGGLEDINGALAQADVLGIFGREGVDLAMLWDPPSTSEPGAYAFRMYRNYDGAGSAFGETSVKAASADQGQLAVYAAQRAQDGALTIMVINKTADELTSTVGLAGFSPQATAAVYRYNASSLARIERPANQPVTAAGFEATFPANSITLVVLPPAGASDTGVQGLWWAGMAENGWGMSLTQHASRLFAGLYVYDSAGQPVWTVMPAGTWNAPRTAFTGSLYIPGGSWFGAYDAAKFQPGSPVGTATITFNGANDAALDYVINGVAGSKRIVRQMFGPVDATPVANYEDLWWGGLEQNGWGVAITQQYRTLFAVWYTYDTAGKAKWFAMSGGTWTAADTYTGTAYRTTASPWLGATYDPARFLVTDVGKVTFTFAGTNAATMTYTIDGITQSKAITRQPF